MKNINHRDIRLIREDLTPYDTIIDCQLPLPKFILDHRGRLFQKNRTIFESGQSKVVYSEAIATNLTSVEIAGSAIEIHSQSTPKGR